MNETITATFENDYDSSLEVAAAADPFMQSTSERWIRNVYIGFVLVLMMCGTYAILDYLLQPAAGINNLYMLLVSAPTAYGIFISIKLLDRPAYTRFCQTSFGGKTNVIIDANGFALQTPNSNWLTGWGDITEIFMTKNTLGIIMPMTAFYVPKTAFDDPNAVFHSMQRWHKDSKA